MRHAWVPLVRVAGLLLIVATLIGCTLAVETSSLKDVTFDPDTNRHKGVIYYLPTARIRVKVSETSEKIGGQDIPVFLFEPLASVPYPDTAQPLLLKFKPAVAADEHFCVEREPTGLLKRVELDSADRTGDIAVKIAETVATAVLRVPGGGIGVRKAERVSTPRQPLELVFNPCEPTERELATIQLKEWFRMDKDVTLTLPGCNRTDLKARCESGSLCYRTMTKILFAVRVGTAGQPPDMVANLTADFPDLENVGVLDIKRTMLTRTVSELSFNNGMLTSFSVSRPSPLYEAARLPLRIVNAVLDVPVQFFNKIARGFQSEAAANQAAAELIKAQAELARVQKASPTPAPGEKPPGDVSKGPDIGSDQGAPSAFESTRVCRKGGSTTRG